MNYLSHAYRYMENPYFVAGVALPDWLSVVGRQFRARSNAAKLSLATLDEIDNDSISTSQRLGRDFTLGIIQHHLDDEAFHKNETFILMSAKLAVGLREIHGPESSIRSGFLGHIIIELLLDDCLIKSNPSLINDYYLVVGSVNRTIVCEAAAKVVGRDVPGLDKWIERFVEERFLADYADDRRLLHRVNQIMKRVGLECLGDETLPWLAFCRAEVDLHSQSLLDLKTANLSNR